MASSSYPPYPSYPSYPSPMRTGSWECSSKDQASLISNLVRVEVLVSEHVVQAFERVDRGDFVPFRDFAYQNCPQKHGSFSISAPHLHGAMLPGKAALDVGCGSGYLAIVMALCTGTTSVGVDVDESAIRIAVECSRTSKHASTCSASFSHITSLDEVEGAYDAIVMGCTFDSILDELLRLLKVGGTICVCVGGSLTKIYEESDDKPTTRVVYTNCGCTPAI